MTSESNTTSYHLVFDGFPSPDGPRFIELEDDSGRSIKTGEWKKRADGLAELVLPVTPAPESHMASRLVIVESPFAGDVEANIAYARAALRDCLDRGEAPYASHLLYTQPGVLDDNDADQRRHGIEAGLAWGKMATATVVYTDRGISAGMQQGIDRAEAEGRAIEYRSIEKAAAE